MTITLQKQIEETLEIIVPSFYKSKSGRSFVGLLDEETIVQIYQSEGHLNIQNSNVKYCHHVIKDIPNDYHSCTESEFLDKYAEVERAMSLHPILVP